MINLEHLTEGERQIIMGVLQKDQAFMQTEEERVKKLKTELHDLRRKSAIKVDDENAAAESEKKACARCREPLGTLFGSGEMCPRCQHKVCTSCKVTLPAADPKKWLCTVCHKTLQIKLESGEVFKSKDGPDMYGTDLVRLSLQKGKTGANDPTVIVEGGPRSPADSGFHGNNRGNNRRNNVSSLGESTEVDTTYEDEYLSDEHSMVESIGPSVSQRGGYTPGAEQAKSRKYGSEYESEITLERISGGEPQIRRNKGIASYSGIESVYNGRSVRGQAISSQESQIGQNSENPTPQNYSQVGTGPFSNNRYTSEVSPKNTSQIRLGGTSKEGYAVGSYLPVGKGNDFQLTNSGVGFQDSVSKLPSVGESSLEGGERASPSSGVQPRSFTPLPHPSFLPTTSPALLTPTGSLSLVGYPDTHPRLAPFSVNPYGHVTNQTCASTDLTRAVHSSTPTSNSLKVETAGSSDVSTEQVSSNYMCMQAFIDSMDDTFSLISDTPGDDSSRLSDTDTMSITSSSTVAWDMDSKDPHTVNKDASSQLDSARQLANAERSNAYSSARQGPQHIRDSTLKNKTTVASSGYDSTSSLSISSEKSQRLSAETEIYDINVNKIVIAEDQSKYSMQSYLNSDAYAANKSAIEYLSASDKYFHARPDAILPARRLPPLSFPSTDSDSADRTLSDDDVESDYKPPSTNVVSSDELATTDILYLQEQGNLIKAINADNMNAKQHNQISQTAANERSSMESVVQAGGETVSSESPDDLRLTFEDLGSINSDYVPFSSGKDDEDDSDISSVDPALLAVSSDEDDNVDVFVDYATVQRKKVLAGKDITLFDQDSVTEDSRDSTSEWGLGDESDGLVPLILPGMTTPESQQLSSREESSSREDDDSLVQSLLRRFVGRPKSSLDSSSASSIKKSGDEGGDDDEDGGSLHSIELSQDSDSGEETCIDLDPSNLAYSEEEKDAVLKTKLEYNRSLMKALLRESEEELMLSSDREKASGDERGHTPRSAKQDAEHHSSSKKSKHRQEKSNEVELSRYEEKKQPKEQTKKASDGDDEQSRQRRKKKTKSDSSVASVSFASKKGIIRHSQKEYGLLSSSTDGKNQLYTLGGEKDGSKKTVDMSRGKYSTLVEPESTPQPRSAWSSGESGPYIGRLLPQPQIYRKKQSHEKTSSQRLPSAALRDDSSSSSSSSDDDDDKDDDDKDDTDEVDGDGPNQCDVDGIKRRSANEIWSMRTLSSQTADDSSDSELSVILEEPEEEEDEVYGHYQKTNNVSDRYWKSLVPGKQGR